MTHAVGTNQYKVKSKKDIGAYMITFIYLMAFMTGLYDLQFVKFPPQIQAQEIISPVATQSAVLKVSTPSAVIKPQYTQEDIEAYIKTIFGRDGAMAVQVSHHECSPSHKMYPGCVKKDNIEWSCGIWQINLRDPKTMKLIHAAKVPGDTLEDKCNWLKDPYQSTLVAFYIYSHQDFCPWTWYKNNYCK